MTPARRTQNPGDWRQPWSAVADRFGAWLAANEVAKAREWSNRLRARDLGTAEGALGEALAWNYLRSRVDETSVHDLGGAEPTPDLRCMTSGSEFLVEVNTLTREAVSRWTGLADDDRHVRAPQEPAVWNRHVKRQTSEKARQGRDADVPFVVFHVTLHRGATRALCTRANAEALLGAGPDRFAHSLFTRRGEALLERRHLSAVLVGGFGGEFGGAREARVHGLIHPGPLRPFSPEWIRGLPFVSASHWPPPLDGPARAEWTIPRRRA